MPHKPFEPNRLRQSVPPNTLRGFDTPGSWLAKGVTAGAQSTRGAPPRPRPRGRRRAAVGPGDIGRIGLLLAVAGVLPLLNAEFRWEEVGLGLMSVGVGLMLVAPFWRSLRSPRASGRSGSSPLGLLRAAPYWAALPAIGGCLIVAGAFLLADAVARG